MIKIRKLEINKEFISGKDIRLKVLAFAFNYISTVEKDIGMEISFNTDYHMQDIYDKKSFYKNIEDKYKQYRKTKTMKEIKDYDISKIIENSIYKPGSFYFIKNFFSSIFENSLILDNFKYKREKRNSVGWLYKNILLSFLEKFTNIEDVCNDFIEKFKGLENAGLVDNYGDSQIYELILLYIKRNKKLSKKIADINGLTVDNQFLILQKGEQIKKLNFRKMLYYKASFDGELSLIT